MPYCCLSSSSVNCLGGGGGTGWFLFHTLLPSGPVPTPFALANVRETFIPLPDLATNRGFAVWRAEASVCPDGVALSPGRTTGVEATDLARKFLVTETDLNEEGFLIEFDRKCPAGLSFEVSTLPGRLISVSDPPLASPSACCEVASSDTESSPESPFTSCASVFFPASFESRVESCYH